MPRSLSTQEKVELSDLLSKAMSARANEAELDSLMEQTFKLVGLRRRELQRAAVTGDPRTHKFWAQLQVENTYGE